MRSQYTHRDGTQPPKPAEASLIAETPGEMLQIGKRVVAAVASASLIRRVANVANPAKRTTAVPCFL